MLDKDNKTCNGIYGSDVNNMHILLVFVCIQISTSVPIFPATQMPAVPMIQVVLLASATTTSKEMDSTAPFSVWKASN